MKLLIIFFSYAFTLVFGAGSIYDIQVNTIDGDKINFSSYQGKKIIISEFDVMVPDINQLVFLDSLQTISDSVVVIGVPAVDFSGTRTLQDLITLRDSLNLHFLITEPVSVKKIADTGQSPLFKFLTNSNENGHFDEEVEEPDQLYFIDGTGTLYSVLRKETPHNVINDVFNQL